MHKRKVKTPKKTDTKREQANPGEIRLRPAGEVLVKATEAPPTPTVKKVIHERRFPPRVPEAPPKPEGED
jgi:hypothetical protein